MKENEIVLFELKNKIRDYPWGSFDGLSLYCGIDVPSNKPAAECWMGAHPEASSIVLLADGVSLSLRELIDRQPERTLGVQGLKTGAQLPFLFKALSASFPLSIQVHPDKRTATQGFEREESLGIPRDSPLRTYRDANHKPELALALSPFKALCGFRAPRETVELFGPTLSSMLGLRKGPDAEEYRNLLARILRIGGKEKKALKREAGARALMLASSGDGEAREAGATVLRLTNLYPGDAGALAPLFMNLLRLEPGQGLYIPPGLMHSYLEGTILEVMASSDNVVRGGLTAKHIDVDELLRVVDPGARFGLWSKARPGALPNIETWPCPAEEFALERLRPDSGNLLSITSGGPEILFCAEGSALLAAVGASSAKAPEEGTGKEVHLRRGSSAFLGASCRSYALRGPGTVYRVLYPGSGIGAAQASRSIP